MTRKVGKEGCYALEVVNRFVNFGVINLYYVPLRDVTAAELEKKAILLWQHILLSPQGCTFLHTTHFKQFVIIRLIWKLHNNDVKDISLNSQAAVVKQIAHILLSQLMKSWSFKETTST